MHSKTDYLELKVLWVLHRGSGEAAGVGHWRSCSWTTCGLRVKGLRRRNVAWLTGTGLVFHGFHIFLHWRFAVRVENVVGWERHGSTGGFGM